MILTDQERARLIELAGPPTGLGRQVNPAGWIGYAQGYPDGVPVSDFVGDLALLEWARQKAEPAGWYVIPYNNGQWYTWQRRTGKTTTTDDGEVMLYDTYPDALIAALEECQ